MKTLNQSGAAHLVAAGAIMLFAIVGLAGWQVMKNNKLTPQETSIQASSVQTPANITSKSDLQQAGKALDSDQSSNALDSTQLDGDISSLL